MTEEVEQLICIKFGIKLEHSFMEHASMDSEGFWGQCNECSTNKNVAQMLQRWLRICWKWSIFWKVCHKQNTWERWMFCNQPMNILQWIWAAINKDQRLTVRELEADLGIPKLLCPRFIHRILAWNMLWQNLFCSFSYQSRRNIVLQLLKNWFKPLTMNQISSRRS